MGHARGTPASTIALLLVAADVESGASAQRVLNQSAVPLPTVGGSADDEGVVGATVVRWRRYGKDRLYVNGPDGERYGWGDVETGTIEVAEAHHRQLVEALLSEHPAWRHSPTPGVTRRESPVGGARPSALTSAIADSGTEPIVEPSDDVTRAWVDLALNRPGEAARTKAVELRQAAPIRTTLARFLGVHTDERAWRIGADGEESVARELAKLGDEWRLLHAIPVGKQGADIDHVLIGPGGVFTINAKHHPGARVWVGGDTIIIGQSRVPYVRNARFEASRASRLLSSAAGRQVHVTGIVAFLCEDLTIKTAPQDVLVIGRRRLRKWLERLGQTLPPSDVASLYEHARRSTTWQLAPGAR